MSMYQNFVAASLEYLYQSIMFYLDQKYHTYPSSLPEIDLPAEVWYQINEGASLATWAAAEYTGVVTGITVI